MCHQFSVSEVEAGMVDREIVANVCRGVAVDRPLDHFASVVMVVQTD